jgi:FKBP-type peptidyl-prolyl cis-trans isomerase SlyD
MRVAAGTAVTIEFELSTLKGELLDWSEPGEPLTFLHGTGRVLPGVERLLFGCQPGDEVTAEIPPEEAFGYRDPELVEAVPRAQLSGGGPIEVGARFESRTGGRARFATVVGFDGDDVLLDLNHPLADRALRIRARVVAVRAATPAELATGTVVPGLSAGPGGAPATTDG